MKFNIFVICVFVCGLSFTSKSQTSSATKKEKEASVKQDLNTLDETNIAADKTVKVKELEKSTYAEGSIPTPESQGFVKQVIDGKDTYTKEEGQIRIQYTPKQ